MGIEIIKMLFDTPSKVGLWLIMPSMIYGLIHASLLQILGVLAFIGLFLIYLDHKE